MKKLTLIIGMLVSANAFGINFVSREVTTDYLYGSHAPRNYVKNEGAEKNLLNVTAANTTLSKNTTAPLHGKADFAATFDSATDSLEWALNTFDNSMRGTCTAHLVYTSSAASIDFQVRRSGATVGGTTLSATTVPRNASVTFDCGDGSAATTVRLIGNSATSTAVKADSLKVIGPGPTSAVINIGGNRIGSVVTTGASNCIWARTSNQSFANFSADSDCADATANGLVFGPGSKVPAVTFTAKAGKRYGFEARGSFGGTSANPCTAWRFSDGTDSSQPQEHLITTSAGDSFTPVITGQIDFSTAGSKTVHIQGTGSCGNQDSRINANVAGIKSLEITVFEYPDPISVTADIFEAGDYGFTETSGFTFSGVGTVSDAKVLTKRVGDTMFVKGYFTNGTVAASAFSINLPSGYTMDTAKLGSAANVIPLGTIVTQSGSGTQSIFSGDRAGFLFYDGSDNDSLFFGRSTSTTNSGQFEKGNGNIGYTGYRVSFEFSIPIFGWSTFPIGVAAGEFPQSKIVCHTANGAGSTNTRIRKFTTKSTDIGSDITGNCTDATNGASFTINKTAYYCLTYTENQEATGTVYFGPSLNSAQLTTGVTSITNTTLLGGYNATENAGEVGSISWCGKLTLNDVVRPHIDSRTGNLAPSRVQFTIERIH